jgi:hypothetical protein
LDTLTGQPTCTLILEPPRYKIVPIIWLQILAKHFLVSQEYICGAP